MDWLRIPEREVEISLAPVDRASYVRFTQKTGRPVPPRSSSSASPVTQVSAAEALAFAAWLSQQDNCTYRLPTLDDLFALADHARSGWQTGGAPAGEGEDMARDDRRPLSEWLHCVLSQGDGHADLRCVANPSWLRKSRRTSTRGALREGRYAFVTFRLVRAQAE